MISQRGASRPPQPPGPPRVWLCPHSLGLTPKRVEPQAAHFQGLGGRGSFQRVPDAPASAPRPAPPPPRGARRRVPEGRSVGPGTTVSVSRSGKSWVLGPRCHLDTQPRPSAAFRPKGLPALRPGSVLPCGPSALQAAPGAVDRVILTSGFFTAPPARPAPGFLRMKNNRPSPAPGVPCPVLP